MLALICLALICAGAALVIHGVRAYRADTAVPVLKERRTDIARLADSPEITALSAATPVHIAIPVLDLEAEVRTQPEPENNEYTPPKADAAYWLASYGAIGASEQRTAYIIGHSTRTGRAVFTDLVDPINATSRLVAGDEIIVTTELGTVVYVVEQSATYARDQLAHTRELWEPKPGRLVLITCLYDRNKQSIHKNVVTYAHLAEASAPR